MEEETNMTKWTKATYEMVASILATAEENSEISDPERAMLADRFAERFAGDNPRFDRERFLTACGVRE